ncbi:hypothetical protein GYMLUDRAFT_258608 [Collybiopsis luxurians FD-317 M1]|nr:hypothetical protein GYMLUDRAFT_258608 [Collybiopsis luxurians FD-317 M1]
MVLNEIGLVRSSFIQDIVIGRTESVWSNGSKQFPVRYPDKRTYIQTKEEHQRTNVNQSPRRPTLQRYMSYLACRASSTNRSSVLFRQKDNHHPISPPEIYSCTKASCIGRTIDYTSDTTNTPSDTTTATTANDREARTPEPELPPLPEPPKKETPKRHLQIKRQCDRELAKGQNLPVRRRHDGRPSCLGRERGEGEEDPAPTGVRLDDPERIFKLERKNVTARREEEKEYSLRMRAGRIRRIKPDLTKAREGVTDDA